MQRIAKSLLQLGQAVGLRVEASGQAAAFARWSSTAATSSAEASSVNPLTKLQSIKKALRPQVCRRRRCLFLAVASTAASGACHAQPSTLITP